MTEQQKRQELVSMRRVATGLFLAMTMLFIGTSVIEGSMELGSWVGFVRAFAEAAMVGALADWFAVTALFRHPMGLPIPHTRIIPQNKERIGQGLGKFIEENFLTETVIQDKLRSFKITETVATWLSSAENTKALSKKLQQFIPSLLHAFDDKKINALIAHNIKDRIRAVDVAPLAGNILSALTSNNKHQEILNEVLRLAATFIDNNQEMIREKVRAESPWYMPEFVDDKVYSTLISKIDKTLREVRNDPQHELRVKFRQSLDEFVHNLKTSPEYAVKAAQIKEELLDNPIVQQYVSSVWDDVKQMVLRDVESNDSAIARHIDAGMQSLGTTLLEDETLRSTLNTSLEQSLTTLLIEQKHLVSTLIADTVNSWDAETLSDKFEVQVGKDLQFIRINGTLVGGLVGLLIYSISFLFTL